MMERALNGMEEMHPTRSKDDPKVTIDPEGTAKEESSEMKTKQQRRTLKAKKPLKQNPDSKELQQMDIRRCVRSKIDSCAKQEFSPNTTTSTIKGKCKGKNSKESQGSQIKQLSIKGMMRCFLKTKPIRAETLPNTQVKPTNFTEVQRRISHQHLAKHESEEQRGLRQTIKPGNQTPTVNN